MTEDYKESLERIINLLGEIEDHLARMIPKEKEDNTCIHTWFELKKLVDQRRTVNNQCGVLVVCAECGKRKEFWENES